MWPLSLECLADSVHFVREVAITCVLICDFVLLHPLMVHYADTILMLLIFVTSRLPVLRSVCNLVRQYD